MKISNIIIRTFSIYALLLSVSYVQVSASDFAGELSEIKGTVQIQKSGSDNWFLAIEEMPVQPLDRIKTFDGSSCNIELDDGSLIFIGENTQASIDHIELTKEKHSSRFSLFFGKLIASVSKNKQTKMSIKTPTAVASVRGTEFAVEVSGEKSDFGVFEGNVVVQGGELTGEEIELAAEQESSVGADMKPSMPQKLREVMLRNRDKMSDLRNKVELLKERLKRQPPQARIEQRAKRIERSRNIRDNRRELMDKNREIRRKNRERKIP